MKNYLLGLYEKSMPNTLSIKEKLAVTKEGGFDYLELSIDETDEKLSRLDWVLSDTEKIVSEMFETGVPIKSICLSGHRRFPLGHPDPAVRAKSLVIMEKAIVLASRLGVRVIQIAGYDVYYEEGSEITRGFFAENLAVSVEIAAKYGVILAFETMETEFLNTVQKAMYWVNKIDLPYLQVYPDMGNLTNAAVLYGHNVTEDIEYGRGHIAAVHLKETVPGVFREVPYATGHVDFAAVTKKALELGCRMFVGEFWYVGQEDWKKTIRENSAFLRSYLDR